MKDILSILFVADVVGKSGVSIVEKLLPGIRKDEGIDYCVANGENAAGGKGLTVDLCNRLYRAGVDIITNGNHIWDKSVINPYLDSSNRILRPQNYPSGNHGRGWSVHTVGKKKTPIGVLNLQGRTFMFNIECPFRAADEKVTELNRNGTKIIIVDIHAEATAEKMALAWYLDGRVSAIIGTHTHVPTSDEQILPQGTAYITDIGMTGPYESVIGMKKETAIRRFLLQTPSRYEGASEDVKLSAALVHVDRSTGKAVEIQRMIYPAGFKRQNTQV